MDFWCEILNWFSYSSVASRNARTKKQIKAERRRALRKLMFGWKERWRKVSEREINSILIYFCRNLTPCLLLSNPSRNCENSASTFGAARTSISLCGSRCEHVNWILTLLERVSTQEKVFLLFHFAQVISVIEFVDFQLSMRLAISRNLADDGLINWLPKALVLLFAMSLLPHNFIFPTTIINHRRRTRYVDAKQTCKQFICIRFWLNKRVLLAALAFLKWVTSLTLLLVSVYGGQSPPRGFCLSKAPKYLRTFQKGSRKCAWPLKKKQTKTDFTRQRPEKHSVCSFA